MKKNSAPRSGKKMPLWAKIVLIILAVVLVLCIAAAVWVHVTLSRITANPIAAPVGTVPPEETGLETTPGDTLSPSISREDVTWADVPQLEGKDVINILLIGQDARPGEERARSDSMILVSINKKTNTIHLTSFMRDLYVQIPGYADNRINTAYRFGGVELLNETLLENFGIVVDGNVAVNFEQFQAVIDTLGGVDVEMDSEEAWYMNDVLDLGPVEEGMNHLNGEQALGFSRIRYITGSDFARTDRQRRVLTALAEPLRQADVEQVLSLLDKLTPNMSTDMTNSEMISYLASAATIYGTTGELISGRIPEDDAYYPANIDGADVLIPYLDKCQEDLKDSIYKDMP